MMSSGDQHRVHPAARACKTRLSITAFWIALCAPLLFCNAATGGGKSVRAIPVESVIIVDGHLSEPEWQQPGITDFTQRDPDEGAPPSQRTEVWVAFDNEALYVAARMFDSAPDSIVARIGRRDADIDADAFAVGIDSYHDRRTGFYFYVTAGGSVGDGILYNDSWDDNSWDGIWETAARTDERGWTAELKIPFSQLRFPRRSEHVWGVNFLRVIERRKEEDYLVMVPKSESGFVSHFADLTGLINITPPARFEIFPYAASNAEFIQHETGDPFHSGSRLVGHAGADLRIGLGSNLTLNGTINPDFGQVEVDPAVVNLTQFETFYEEKRPFFVEGKSFFDFGSGGVNNNWGFNWGNPQYFYSRRIGRTPQGEVLHEGFSELPQSTTIIAAAKLTGKLAEGWSLGTMQSVTAREYGRTDSTGHRFTDVIEPPAYRGVLRTLREFSDGRQALGFLGTATIRDLDRPYLHSTFNMRSFSAGIDGWTNLDDDQRWVINGWLSSTLVEGSPERIVDLQRSSLHYFQQPGIAYKKVDSSATVLSGYAGRVMLNTQKGAWYLNSALGIISPGFDTNDLGFLFRTDIINGHIVVGHRWYEPEGITRRKELYLAAYSNFDFGGRRIGEGYFLFWNAQFTNYWGTEGDLMYSPSVADTRSTRGGPAMRTTPVYALSLSANSDTRTPTVAHLDMELIRSEAGGYRVQLSPGIEWRSGSGIKLGISPAFMRDITRAYWVDAIDDPAASPTFGTRYIFGNLDQRELSAIIRLDWTFTPAMSLQLFLQPLISVGTYSEFKELRQPDSYLFTIYGENGSTIARTPDGLTVDPDGAGPAGMFQFDNPDFNYKSLRANAVLRWEYLPGSTLYLVWSHSRTNEDHPGDFSAGRDLSALFSSGADNVFQLKISYWLSM